MTNLRELAKAAKAAKPGTPECDYAHYKIMRDATPDALLALYAELDEARRAVGQKHDEAGAVPVYRYQTPDHRSFSQTTPPMTPDQSAIELSFASPPSEASREERAAIRKEAFEEAAKVAQAYDDLTHAAADLRDGTFPKMSRIQDRIATAIRARGRHERAT